MLLHRLVVPFVLLALGAWRAIGAAIITAGLLFAPSALLFGNETWRQYPEITGAFQLGVLQRFEGFYTSMMVSGRRRGSSPYTAAMVLQAALALPVLALTCKAVRRTADPCRRAFVVACTTPLVTPYAFNYDPTAVAAALVWILFGRPPWHTSGTLVYLIAWLGARPGPNRRWLERNPAQEGQVFAAYPAEADRLRPFLLCVYRR
jgi:hypothetical protein